MATIPFWLTLRVVIAVGGGLGTAQYPVPSAQELTLNELRFTATGAWGIYAIRNANGRIYTNASQAIPIQSTHFQNGASPNIGFGPMPYPLVLAGNDIIYFDFIDLSAAANTINFTMVGSLNLGG